jgi:two-component system phosphate regulon sensor histidine kinase PhoR
LLSQLDDEKARKWAFNTGMGEQMKFSRVWKLYLVFTIVLAVVMAGSGFYLQSKMENKLSEQLRRQSMILARLIERSAPDRSDPSSMDGYCREMKALSEVRVSVFGREGTVLCDSERPAADLDNHLQRPEVQAALQAGSGTATRFSETLQKRMFYTALWAPEKNIVVRVAVVTADAGRLQNEVMLLLGIFLFLAPLMAIVVSFFFARYLTRADRPTG